MLSSCRSCMYMYSPLLFTMESLASVHLQVNHKPGVDQKERQDHHLDKCYTECNNHYTRTKFPSNKQAPSCMHHKTGKTQVLRGGVSLLNHTCYLAPISWTGLDLTRSCSHSIPSTRGTAICSGLQSTNQSTLSSPMTWWQKYES